ncbi:PadR family transcriptional regulator [Planctomicrobium piriforme]|uniref:Transcriptional regulator PadR-like family protein n=1 Tax=Planctomicrobium piriforme TaxID=1576369 RepID=A0A1I3K4S9_9PLAN|nr:PadR family transcriptional regulator [Planctomicrobium piriforme]SFI67493.1 Transcriptional regulator PadR-like family protein [Planctomicrobium piriforme]
MLAGIRGNQVRGHLETMLLSVLEQGDAHGFEIVKRLEARGCGLLKLKEGSVYPVLYRLERQGLVQATWEPDDNERRGPRRRIYQLTEKGTQVLAAGRQEWKNFVNVVGPILMGAAT